MRLVFGLWGEWRGLNLYRPGFLCCARAQLQCPEPFPYQVATPFSHQHTLLVLTFKLLELGAIIPLVG